jgi:hypothetical protein
MSKSQTPIHAAHIDDQSLARVACATSSDLEGYKGRGQGI